MLRSMGTGTTLVHLWEHLYSWVSESMGAFSSVATASSSLWIGIPQDRHVLVLSWPLEVNHLNANYLD